MSSESLNDFRGDGWATVPSHRDKREKKKKAREPPVIELDGDELPSQSPGPFLLMLIGIPGSGKSTLAEALVKERPEFFVRVNQDTLGTRRQCEDMCRAVLSEGKCAILDRCNFDAEQRKPFLEISKGLELDVDGVVMDIPINQCIDRCQRRKGHPTLAPHEARNVIEGFAKEFRAPHSREKNEFRVIQTIQNNASYVSVAKYFLKI